MNVLAFFATLFICATVIGIICLLLYKPITIKIIHSTEVLKPIDKTATSPQENNNTAAIDTVKTEEELNKNIAKSSMDAVISAANQLMGISTTDIEEDEHGNKD